MSQLDFIFASRLLQKDTTNNSDSSSNASASVPSVSQPQPPLSGSQKLKAAIRDYGSAVLVFHIVSGVTFLGCWYTIISRSDLRFLLFFMLFHKGDLTKQLKTNMLNSDNRSFLPIFRPTFPDPKL